MIKHHGFSGLCGFIWEPLVFFAHEKEEMIQVNTVDDDAAADLEAWQRFQKLDIDAGIILNADRILL